MVRSREAFIIAAAAVAFSACSPRESTGNQLVTDQPVIGTPVGLRFEEPLLKYWIEAPVFANRITSISDISWYQSEQTGLEEVHIYRNNNYPNLVGIYLVWDEARVKTREKSELALDGGVEFQKYDNSFVPKDVTRTNIIKSSGSFQRFAQDNVVQLAQLFRGRRVFGSYVGRDLPAEDTQYAIVLGSKIVEYNGKPSSLTFLRIKFSFPNDIQPRIIPLQA